MIDYYSILGISASATPLQIKEAYRKKLKRMHPDLNCSYDSKKLQQLMLAYRTLSDKKLREDYDKTNPRKKSLRYRSFLLAAKHNPTFLAKLIFYDLLHENIEEAIFFFEDSVLSKGINLRSYMSYVDYMDCLYLLGEAYEQKKCYLAAYRLFITIVRLEAIQPCFHHFIDEIMEKMYRIVSQELLRREPDEVVNRCVEQFTTLPFADRVPSMNTHKKRA